MLYLYFYVLSSKAVNEAKSYRSHDVDLLSNVKPKILALVYRLMSSIIHRFPRFGYQAAQDKQIGLVCSNKGFQQIFLSMQPNIFQSQSIIGRVLFNIKVSLNQLKISQIKNQRKARNAAHLFLNCNKKSILVYQFY